MNKLKSFYRRIVHKLICKYLISCGGAFHHNKYGIDGRYVVLMNDEKYHEYQNLPIE